MKRIAVFAGTFDPVTLGHINIIERGAKLFDKLVVAVATNTTKTPTFSPQERVTMLRHIFEQQSHIEVDAFNGLLVNYCRQKEATVIFRGIRNMSDYECESQMAIANKTLAPEIDTIFMMTEGKYAHLSSSLIKEILLFGGAGGDMLHPIVEAEMKRKLKL